MLFFSLKGLPCTIGHIEANPLLKGTHTMGVLLGEFPLKYEAFDNTVASGKNDNVLKRRCKLTARMIFMIFSRLQQCKDDFEK